MSIFNEMNSVEFDQWVEIGFRGEFWRYDSRLTFYYFINLDKNIRGTWTNGLYGIE